MKKMRSIISSKGQTVVPRQVRQALGIDTGTLLLWEVQNGAILVRPLPRDPVQAAAGSLKGRGLSVEDFLNYRRQEREREQGRE